MNVVCIGAGYVGSVTAAAFAVLGHTVTVIDLDRRKVECINAGSSPIYEPGLSALIKRCAGNSLFASLDYDSIREADVVFICVGTPSKADMSADLTYVRGAASKIGQYLHPQRLSVVVNKSTVPVGTTDLVASMIEDASGFRQGQNFEVVSNPEFLREGFAVEDVFYPDRIVIGTTNDQAENVMKALYDPIMTRNGYGELSDILPGVSEERKQPAWLRTSPKSSELIKYASNAFLAVKISYINEMARLCDAIGASVTEVAAGMGLDSRIGSKFLRVSSGWSGSCFPKDTAELLATASKYGCRQHVVTAAVEANERMHAYCVQKVQAKLKTLQGKRIGVLGLTFKPNTDDARRSQASVIIRQLCDLGGQVYAHDPQGMESFRSLNPDLPVQYCDRPETTAVKSDALILLTDWDCYLGMSWQQVRPTMRHPYVLDTRNVLDGGRMTEWGFLYEGLGI